MEISKTQIEQIDRSKKLASYQRLLTELRQTSPNSVAHLDDTSLLDMIELAAKNAKDQGIRSSTAITLFIKMSVFAGLDFYRQPDIERYLSAPELDQDYKVILLADLLSKKLQETFS